MINTHDSSQNILPANITQLITALQLLPGVGAKGATRLALHLLQQPASTRQQLGSAVLKAMDNITQCQHCCHYATADLCPICSDTKRNSTQICIVEDSLDLIALEQTASYRGHYHVLGGTLAPLDGIGPNDLNLESLHKRLETITEPTEIIFATNPSIEGDATATYIENMIKELNNQQLSVSHLARGIPMGSDMEYIGQRTLRKALEERQKQD